MSDEEFEAELFGPVTSQIFDATGLYDSQTGIWRAPLPYESERDQLRRIYLLDKRNTDPLYSIASIQSSGAWTGSRNRRRD